MTSHQKLPKKDNNEMVGITSHIPTEADFLLVYSTIPGKNCSYIEVDESIRSRRIDRSWVVL